MKARRALTFPCGVVSRSLRAGNTFTKTGRGSRLCPTPAYQTGLDEETLQRALRALNSFSSHFENVSDTSGGIDSVGPPTAAARRAAGAWPSPENLVERIIAALEDAPEDDARSDDQRSKLKQLALGIRSVGYQVAIGAGDRLRQRHRATSPTGAQYATIALREGDGSLWRRDLLMVGPPTEIEPSRELVVRLLRTNHHPTYVAGRCHASGFRRPRRTSSSSSWSRSKCWIDRPFCRNLAD